MMTPLMIGLYVFVLSLFVGFEVITKVPPTLHTPLMSGANAISGITIVGALYCADTGDISLANFFCRTDTSQTVFQYARTRPISRRCTHGICDFRVLTSVMSRPHSGHWSDSTPRRW